MFGVTTQAVQGIVRRLEADFDCLVFHATGTGGPGNTGTAGPVEDLLARRDQTLA